MILTILTSKRRLEGVRISLLVCLNVGALALAILGVASMGSGSGSIVGSSLVGTGCARLTCGTTSESRVRLHPFRSSRSFSFSFLHSLSLSRLLPSFTVSLLRDNSKSGRTWTCSSSLETTTGHAIDRILFLFLLCLRFGLGLGWFFLAFLFVVVFYERKLSLPAIRE
jgi:hypothetical protein